MFGPVFGDHFRNHHDNLFGTRRFLSVNPTFLTDEKSEFVIRAGERTLWWVIWFLAAGVYAQKIVPWMKTEGDVRIQKDGFYVTVVLDLVFDETLNQVVEIHCYGIAFD